VSFCEKKTLKPRKVEENRTASQSLLVVLLTSSITRISVEKIYQLPCKKVIIIQTLRIVPPNTGIFAEVMTTGEKQISARPTGIQKEKCGKPSIPQRELSSHM